MKLKLDAQGNVAVQDGFPVWIAADGKEIPYNVPELVANLSRVNGESAGRRKEIDALTEKLRAFDGLEPEKARAALETVAHIDAGALLDAAKVEELKKTVASAFEAKILVLQKAKEAAEQEFTAKMEAKNASIRQLMVRGAFDRSVYLKEKTVLPPDIAYQSFGQYCEVVEIDGTLRNQWKTPDGQILLSRANPAEPAPDDEAIEALIALYPLKERILKAVPGGSGASAGSRAADGKTLSRAAFETLDAARRMRVVQDGIIITD